MHCLNHKQHTIMTATQQELQASLIHELTILRREYQSKLVEARSFFGRSGEAKTLMEEIAVMKELIAEAEQAIVTAM